jgi:hypothetical protein
MVVMVAIAAVSASFGLERGLYLQKISSEAAKHVLDHMVGPNAKNLVSNFGRQMPISQMPGKPDKLIRIFMFDFDDKLGSRLNLEPPPILKEQAIAIGHRNCFWKVQKDIFAVIRRQANAAPMAGVKIESERACRLFCRPMPGWAMN